MKRNASKRDASVSVGRDTGQPKFSSLYCKLDLATLKVAIKVARNKTCAQIRSMWTMTYKFQPLAGTTRRDEL